MWVTKQQASEDVKDDSYHTALEAVFRVAKTEASNYARASKSTKSRVEGRLLSCASVIRVLVEAGLKKLRYKTVRALVEHITQTLPTTQGDYCEPLLGDYLKALVLLLEYKAHPEHFLGDEWQELMDFCVQMVYDLDSRTEANDSRTSNGSIAPNGSGPFGVSHSRSTTPSMVGDRRIKHSNNVSQRSVASRLEESDTDIILCLLHLTSVPNAPIFDRASVVLTALIELLQNYSRVSSIKQIAFECLNSVMSRIVFNDIDLALDTMTKVMPLLRQFWKSTEATLNEVLMVFLSYGEILLPRLISADRSAGCIATLQALVEVLRTDYCERTNRTQLQLQDLVLVDPTYPSTKTLPLCTSTVQVRMGTLRAESPWCLIARSATIMVALENSLKAEDSADRDDVHHIPKRQRLERPLDDVLRLMKGTILPEKLYALQILVFVFEDLKFDESSLQGYLESILPCVSHNDGLIASWAMVVMASYVLPTGCHLKVH